MAESIQFPAFVRNDHIQVINGYLLEGLFFHRSDKPELFGILYDHREKFKEFWKRTFDVELVVKNDVAYRRHQNTDDNPFTGFRNQNIDNGGRFHFYWSGPKGKLNLLVFQRFLFYYQTELGKRNPNKFGEYEFQSLELWAWLTEQLASFFETIPNKPKPNQIFESFRTVLADMERFGFTLKDDELEVAKEEQKALRDQNYGDVNIHKYLARPGLASYDPIALQEDPTSFVAAFTADEEDEETEVAP